MSAKLEQLAWSLTPEEIMPAEWRAHSVEVTSTTPEMIQITGAVSPCFKSGKKKGRRNWSKRDKSTERVFLVHPDTYRKWFQKG
jgi:hypothetical protein